MLTGIIHPTKGEISVFGYAKPYELKDEFKKIYSVVMGQSQLWWDLPAIDTFNLNKELYEIEEDGIKRINILSFLELLGVKIAKNSSSQLVSW